MQWRVWTTIYCSQGQLSLARWCSSSGSHENAGLKSRVTSLAKILHQYRYGVLQYDILLGTIGSTYNYAARFSLHCKDTPSYWDWITAQGHKTWLIWSAPYLILSNLWVWELTHFSPVWLGLGHLNDSLWFSYDTLSFIILQRMDAMWRMVLMFPVISTWEKVTSRLRACGLERIYQ